MIRFIVTLLAAASPAAAQVAPLSFDAGKALPIAAGQWTYFAAAGGSLATYGSHLQLRCERATRTVAVTRPNAAPAPLTIATDSLTRAVPASGRLLANDPLLDSIAFSRGRIVISGGGGPTVAVPSWPEAARAIEDCRN